MAATSFWYVSLVPPERVNASGSMIASFATSLADDPTVRRGLEEWRFAPESVHGPQGQELTPAASAYLDAFKVTELGEDELLAHSIPETEELTWDLQSDERPHQCRGLFAAVRGVPVVSLLFLAIGPLRATWLPGNLGVFAVGPEDLLAAADGVRRAHALSPADRASAIRRMHGWLEVGQDPGFPVHHLLEALPEVFATATMEGAGVIGLTGVSSS